MFIAEADPCKTKDYKILSEPDRAAGFETIDAPQSDRNHFNKSAAWYQFSGEAGWRMAKRCVPSMRCGAEATGWLSGSHPSEQEGIVNRTVCFNSGDDCCFWKSQVKVRNCSGFYLYYLKRDVRGAYEKYRYCGNGKGIYVQSSSELSASDCVTSARAPTLRLHFLIPPKKTDQFCFHFKVLHLNPKVI